MLSLGKTLDRLTQRRRQWEKLAQFGARAAAPQASHTGTSLLKEVSGFGSNPGALRMFSYVPRSLPESPALVVVLHGCTQTAEDYDHGAGWSTLADRYGFALVLPEQQRSNNPKTCFNWFQPGDIARGQGEALSIRQMVERMVTDHGIDQRRVFVTGLSAGGAMTSVMLATYPEVFAGGAIIAGLPYGGANNVQAALESMFQGRTRPARAWGDLVRRASPHSGPWPTISVWHGSADPMVKPTNADEIIKQWTDVHGLPSAPTSTQIVDGYPRRVWRNAEGADVIESYTITGMAHGTPLATGDPEGSYGAPGPFMLEAGIASSFHIAQHWGLTGHPRPHAAREVESASISPEPPGGEREQAAHPEVKHARARSLPLDIQSVITKALRAAGLMKSPH